MESLLMQLAMAALSQFGGGGMGMPMGLPMGGGIGGGMGGGMGLPASLPIRPVAPSSPGKTECVLRKGIARGDCRVPTTHDGMS